MEKILDAATRIQGSGPTFPTPSSPPAHRPSSSLSQPEALPAATWHRLRVPGKQEQQR